MNQRDQILDGIRTLAIFLVIYQHLYDYIPISQFGPFFEGVIRFTIHMFRYMALSLFCFTSGILLNKSFDKFSSISYLKHRFFRIYPLYYLAFAAFILIIGRDTLVPFTWQAVVFHILSMHIIFRNSYCEPMATLWYIGLVFYFDLFLMVASHLAKRNVKPLITATLFVFFWFSLKFIFNIGDHRFLIYFPVFLFGFYYNNFKIILQRKRMVLFSLAALIFFLIIYKNFFYEILSSDRVDSYSLFSLFSLMSLFIVAGFMFAFVLCGFNFFKWIPFKSKYLIPSVAFASFSIYLFHRPVINLYLSVPALNNLHLINYLILPVILIFVGFLIQKSYQFCTIMATKVFDNRDSSEKKQL